MEVRQVLREAHEQRITCLAYASKTKELFTGSEDTDIKVWECESGRYVRCIKFHSGWVTGLEYSNELNMLFSSSLDGKIAVWTLKQDFPMHVEEVRSPLYCLALDERRNALYTGMFKKIMCFSITKPTTVETFNTKPTLVHQHTIQEHTDYVKGLVCNDKKIYSAGFDKSIVLYPADHPHKRFQKVENAHDGAISVIDVDSDNNWIITGSYDRTVKIWTSDLSMLQEFKGFPDTITGVCYIPTTKMLWVATGSNQPLIYDARTGIDVTRFIDLESPQTYGMQFQAFHYLRETGEVYGISDSRHLAIWRFNPHSAVSMLRGHSDAVQALTYFAQGGRPTIFSGGADQRVLRWEQIQLHNALYSHDTVNPGAHDAPITCMAYNNETRTLISGSEDAVLMLHHNSNALDDFKELEEQDEAGRAAFFLTELDKSLAQATIVEGEEEGEGEGTGVQQDDYSDWSHIKISGHEAHSEQISALACARDCVISVSWDKSIRVWNTLTGKLIKHRLDAHDSCILDVDYTADLNKFITGGSDNLAKVWDYSSMKLVMPLAAHSGDVTSVKWNPVHSLWVTGSDDRTIRTWSEDGLGKEIIHCRGDGITAMCIDTNQGHIIAAASDRHVRVYDPISTDTLIVLSGHTDFIVALIHIPEKRQYLTASMDNNICVWSEHVHRKHEYVKVEPIRLGDPRIRPPEDIEEEEEEEEYSEILGPVRVPSFLKKLTVNSSHIGAMEATGELKKQTRAREEERTRKRKNKPLTALEARLDRIEAEIHAKDEGVHGHKKDVLHPGARRLSIRPSRRMSFLM